MKVSWAVIVVCTVVIVAGLAVLAPAGYRAGGSSNYGGGYGDYDSYAAEGSNSAAATNGGAMGGEELMIDENTPSMLLEKNAFFADPNAVKTLIAAYPELEKPLAELSRRSRIEVRQWLAYKENQDLRVNEVRAMLMQSTTELQVLKKVAAADGAKRTVAAIDAMLLERKGRYERLAKEIVLQQRKLALAKKDSSGSTGTSSRRTGQYGNSRTGGGRTGGSQSRRR